jgi:uncharacterized protein (DUF983 family)
MQQTPTAWTAFKQGKCPQCRSGKLFKTGPFNLSHFREMHTHCPECGVKFEPEPGFFWGAMYFSYAIVVAMCLILGIILFSIIDEPELWSTSGIIIGAILLISPLVFRMSRKLMVYVTAPYRFYDAEAVARFKEKQGKAAKS